MRVIWEREEVEFDMEAVEVGAVQSRLKSFMGIPSEATAYVDGTEVGGRFSGNRRRLLWHQP